MHYLGVHNGRRGREGSFLGNQLTYSFFHPFIHTDWFQNFLGKKKKTARRDAGSGDRGGGRDSNVGGEAPGGALLANWPHSMRPTRCFGYAERSG